MSMSIYVIEKPNFLWRLRCMDGYILSKPIEKKVTHALFIDGHKLHAKSTSYLKRMLQEAKYRMRCVGLLWNEKKKKHTEIILDESFKITSLKDQESYKCMGVPQADTHQVGKVESNLSKVVQQRWVFHKLTLTK